MSDFLGTLVARSLSAPLGLPVVQPRLPSRFEPDGAAAGATFAEREVEADPRVASEPVAAHAQPTAAHAAPQPRPQPAEREVRATPREMRPVVDDDAPLPRVTPRVDGDEHETPRPARSASTPPVVTPAPRPTARVPPSEAPVAVPRREAATAATPAPATARREIETRTVVVERERSERRSPATDAARPARVVPVVTPAPPALRPEPPAAFPSPAAAAEPAPVIHVTIGRIEVRTRETRGAPVRERAAAGPLTSLEDYLARRRRGGGAS